MIIYFVTKQYDQDDNLEEIKTFWSDRRAWIFYREHEGWSQPRKIEAKDGLEAFEKGFKTKQYQ